MPPKDEQIAELRKDVDNHEERIRAQELTSAAREEQIKALYTAVGRIEQMYADIKADVQALMQKPANRWEALVGYLVAAVVGAVVAALVKGAI